MNNNFSYELAARIAASAPVGANSDDGDDIEGSWSVDGSDAVPATGSAAEASLQSLQQHLEITGLLNHISGLHQRLMEVDTEIGTVRSTAKSTGLRLLTQVEETREQLRTLDVRIEGLAKSLVSTREDVTMQHQAGESAQRSITVLTSELEALSASLDSSKLVLNQVNRQFDGLAVAVENIRKRHFSVLTLGVAIVVGSVALAMVIMGVGRLSKVPDADRLDVIEQYVIRHQQQLEHLP